MKNALLWNRRVMFLCRLYEDKKSFTKRFIYEYIVNREVLVYFWNYIFKPRHFFPYATLH